MENSIFLLFAIFSGGHLEKGHFGHFCNGIANGNIRNRKEHPKIYGKKLVSESSGGGAGGTPLPPRLIYSPEASLTEAFLNATMQA